jgi:hypothetical protein
VTSDAFQYERPEATPPLKQATQQASLAPTAH